MSGTIPRSNNQPLTVQSWSDTDGVNVYTVVTSHKHNHVSNQLNRVTRPTISRRRSRVSRKTPTTLLNTDTTNFRAMVQRFTGGGNNGYDVTSAPRVLNNYTAASSSLGVPALGPNESYNMEFRPPNNQTYYSVAEDGAVGSNGTAHYDYDYDYDYDQQMGYRQIGYFNL